MVAKYLEKAYDRIDWGFLEHIFKVVGFSDHMAGLLCVVHHNISFGFMDSEQLRASDPLEAFDKETLFFLIVCVMHGCSRSVYC